MGVTRATWSFKIKEDNHLGDNCIQNFHLGRYIVGYTVGNLVLRRSASGAVKHDLRTYIRRYTSPTENFEYGYPHSNALLQFALKVERCKPFKTARHRTECDVIYDVKLFQTVYRRIYCRKSLTLSNQTSRYKLKCIRMHSDITADEQSYNLGTLQTKSPEMPARLETKHDGNQQSNTENQNCLTHLCLMASPVLIIWTNQIPI